MSPSYSLRASVALKAPASIANIGPGFDVLALAIKDLYDYVSMGPGGGVIAVSSSGFNVPSGQENVGYVVAKEFTSKYDIRGVNINIEVHKGILPSCGLGSSGATLLQLHTLSAC